MKKLLFPSFSFFLFLFSSFFFNVMLSFSQNCFSTSSAIDNFESQIIQSADGGYAIAGTHWSASPTYRGMVTKMDSMGNVSWAKTFGAPGNERAYSVIQTNDSNFLIAGQSAPVFPNQYWLLKLD